MVQALICIERLHQIELQRQTACIESYQAPSSHLAAQALHQAAALNRTDHVR
jgi:hypothetical protein